MAFFPQDEQALHLQVKGMIFIWEHSGLEHLNSLKPRTVRLQLSSLMMEVTMDGLKWTLCFS